MAKRTGRLHSPADFGLAVELHGTIVGTVDGDARTFDFSPSNDGMEWC